MSFSYEYEPNICKGDDAKFTGKIKLKGLHFEKKMELLETLEKEGLGLGQLQALGEDAQKDPMKAIRIMGRFVVLTKDQYESATLKHKATGSELKTYDDIASFPEAHSVLGEVAMHIIAGGLGK